MQEQKTLLRGILVILFFVVGSLLLVSWVMPKIMNWYVSPLLPAGAGLGVSCAPSIDWAIQKMLWFQLASVLIGTIFGAIVVFKFRLHKSKD